MDDVMTRKGRRIGIALLVVIAIVVLIVVIFDWNWLKGPIQSRVSDATGRTFVINGDLDVDLSLRPQVRVQGIVLGNAEWGSAPEMLTMDELAFRVDLPKLLRGQVVLPEIRLQKPRLLLEQNAQKQANWQFTPQEGEDKKSGAAPQIARLDIQDGTLTYKNPTIDTDVTVGLNTTASGPDGYPGIKLQGHGNYRGEEFRLRGEMGGVLALRDQTRPYPISLEATAGKVKASVNGALPIPLSFDTIDLNLHLQGPDLALLYPLVPVSLPESPPFELKGHLLHSENTWHFENFSGKVGDSDLSGDFKVILADRIVYTGDLTSHRLAFKDIAGFIHAKDKTNKAGEEEQESQPDQPKGKVLPHRPYNLERINVTDADVRFRGKQVVATRLPFDDVEAHFKLKNGHLTIDPLNFGVAGGTLATQLTLDARKNPMNASLDIHARRLQLGKLVPSLEEKVGEGIITGRGHLKGTGNSVAALLGSADGEIAAIMSGGNISKLLLKLSNIDIAKAVPLLLAGDEKTAIRCVAADFKANNGVLKAQTLVLDTADTKITGEGSISLKEERIDLQLRAHGKKASPFALHGPIRLAGTFSKPDVNVDKGEVTARVGAATALGVLLGPLAAFIPVMEWGLTEDSNCGALLQEVRGTASAGPRAQAQ